MRLAQAGGPDVSPELAAVDAGEPELSVEVRPPAWKFSRRLVAARRSGLVAADPAAPATPPMPPARNAEVVPPATPAPARAAPPIAPPAAPTLPAVRAAPAAPTPATAIPVPTAAPVPSCGPPAIKPLAMPAPKIERPSSARAARIRVRASSMVGGLLKPLVN